VRISFFFISRPSSSARRRRDDATRDVEVESDVTGGRAREGAAAMGPRGGPRARLARDGDAFDDDGGEKNNHTFESGRASARARRSRDEANGWVGWRMVWDKRLTLTLRGVFFARSRYRRAVERGVRRASGAKQGSSRAFVSRGAYVQQGAQV